MPVNYHNVFCGVCFVSLLISGSTLMAFVRTFSSDKAIYEEFGRTDVTMITNMNYSYSCAKTCNYNYCSNLPDLSSNSNENETVKYESCNYLQDYYTSMYCDSIHDPDQCPMEITDKCNDGYYCCNRTCQICTSYNVYYSTYNFYGIYTPYNYTCNCNCPQYQKATSCDLVCILRSNSYATFSYMVGNDQLSFNETYNDCHSNSHGDYNGGCLTNYFNSKNTTIMALNYRRENPYYIQRGSEYLYPSATPLYISGGVTLFVLLCSILSVILLKRKDKIESQYIPAGLPY